MIVTLPRLCQIYDDFDDSRTLHYTPLLTCYMINFSDPFHTFSFTMQSHYQNSSLSLRSSWFPLHQRVLFKVCLYAFKILNHLAHEYFNDTLQIYTPSRNLRSVTDTCKLIIPKSRLSAAEFSRSSRIKELKQHPPFHEENYLSCHFQKIPQNLPFPQ